MVVSWTISNWNVSPNIPKRMAIICICFAPLYEPTTARILRHICISLDLNGLLVFNLWKGNNRNAMIEDVYVSSSKDIQKTRCKAHRNRVSVYYHILIYLCTTKVVCRCQTWQSHWIKVLESLVSALFCWKQTSIFAMSTVWVSICFLLTSIFCAHGWLDVFAWVTYDEMHSVLLCHKCIFLLGRYILRLCVGTSCKYQPCISYVLVIIESTGNCFSLYFALQHSGSCNNIHLFCHCLNVMNTKSCCRCKWTARLVLGDDRGLKCSGEPFSWDSNWKWKLFNGKVAATHQYVHCIFRPQLAMY